MENLLDPDVLPEAAPTVSYALRQTMPPSLGFLWLIREHPENLNGMA